MARQVKNFKNLNCKVEKALKLYIEHYKKTDKI